MAPTPSKTAATPRAALKSDSVFKLNIFDGKVLFCTGGGSGICKDMTEAIMRHGANAVIVGRNLERITQSAKELSSSTGKSCLPAQADVRKPEQLRAAVQKTIDNFGRIDFVICGAAGNFMAPIEGLSDNAFRTVLEIDTMGTYSTIKATLPYVRETRGSYICVSATLHYRATPFQVHVSAAKAGVDALSAALAIEEGPRGVRSNVIAPGPIDGTTGMDKLGAKGGENDMTKSIPLQRMGHVADISNAAVFLFSEAANWITATVTVVDGGSEHTRHTMLPYPESVLDPEGAKSLIKTRL